MERPCATIFILCGFITTVFLMANTHCMTDTGLAESIMRKEIGHAASTLHTHHQASLTVSLYSMLVLSLRLCIGPACEIGLSTGT